MTRDAEDEDHTRFVRFEGLRAPDRDEDAVLSLAAFQLHGFGMMNSIKDGHPGFVSDDYLNAISAESSITATELCTAGLWVRVTDGYEILGDEMFHMSIGGNRRARDGRVGCSNATTILVDTRRVCKSRRCVGIADAVWTSLIRTCPRYFP